VSKIGCFKLYLNYFPILLSENVFI